MTIIWVIVALFAGDPYGVMASKDEFKTLQDCQVAAHVLESLLQEHDKGPTMVFCVAKEGKEVL